MLRTLVHPLSLTAAGALFLTLLMTVFPNEALQSSLRGLSIWWHVLFPSLFPFFVISEVMLGIGIVHFFGKLLDPFMKPLFRVPGIGGFVFAMGNISGYPVGAKLTSQLREQNLISRVEGERLVAFTTSSDPIFLIGAVSVGFFQNVAVAPVLAAAHYGGGLLIGLIMRFYGRKEDQVQDIFISGHQKTAVSRSVKRSRLNQALRAMHEARLLDGRTLSRLIQDAIQTALKLMIVVGGLVVFFSVILEMLIHTGFLEGISACLRFIFELCGMPAPLADAIIFGLFEVTLGARSAGTASSVLMHQVAIAAWVLSWGGLSVHAQIASLLSKTDLRYRPLLLARLLHSFIAFILVYMLWGWLGV
ncbi:sporulation integral membrane protein YlbJ [Paenibacillus sp. IITD108]|uniref:sporulation integral membrane protein YlbJ n=1 Tax=Paenibacillus sp. IITD108 TaxID=3116649 RepID=UPI002F41550E